MAEKRYYWLKLKEDYFNSPKIKKLRKIAGGDTYTIIYLKMQLLSISNKGIIVFEGIENTFEEELALKLDEQFEDVQLTLAYLQTQSLIEKSENQFLLPEASNSIGSECDSAERVRAFRERKNNKALQRNNSVTQVKQNSISISNSKSIYRKNICILKKKNDNIYSTKDNNITEDNTIHSLKSLKRKYIPSNKDSYVDKISTLYTKEKIKENTNQINNNKDILKEKKKESPEVVEVFEFYQDAGLKKMRTLTDKAEKTIKKALKDYSVEELKTLIKRFKCIVKDEFYYYNYSWNVEEFFSRKEGYREFDDNGSKWQSYIAERPTIKTEQYFEPLWEMYPNKSSVREAKREFQKKFVGITDDNTALQKARYIYSRCRDYVQDTDDQYIMALSRWLESNIS